MAALGKHRHPHFEITTVCRGVDLVVMVYRTHNDATRAEVLRFTDRMAVEGHGTVPA
ncbi:MAG TPA: hypothetical protein VGM82_08330 [Gemmatimonadaceae bacterium]